MVYTSGKEKETKTLLAALAVCLAVSVPSFGAEHVVTHSAKVAGKDTYKTAKHSAKDAGKTASYSVKGTGKVLKSVF